MDQVRLWENQDLTPVCKSRAPDARPPMTDPLTALWHWAVRGQTLTFQQLPARDCGCNGHHCHLVATKLQHQSNPESQAFPSPSH